MFDHAWVLFIAVTSVNGAIWWSRGKKEVERHPELAQGYRRLVRGWLVYANLPWVVMGVGILSGVVPSMLSFFNPRNGPFVVLWYITVVLLWVASVYWVFFRGGAEELVRHPGLSRSGPRRAWIVKLDLLLTLAGGIAGLLFMIVADMKVP